MIYFLSIVLSIFGILQIILFFKMWGMTNDVNRIKGVVSETNDFNWAAAKLETLAGDYKKAYKVYFKCFISDTYELYQKSSYNMMVVYYADEYTKRFNALKGECSIGLERYDILEKIRRIIFRA